LNVSTGFKLIPYWSISRAVRNMACFQSQDARKKSFLSQSHSDTGTAHAPDQEMTCPTAQPPRTGEQSAWP